LNVDNWLIALAIKPFVLIALLVPVAILGRWILSRLPDGRLKRLLSHRVGP
jgi:hypothetical protein